jgi:hypothetical protein
MPDCTPLSVKIRRRLWFMTARGREIHRIKAMLRGIVARAENDRDTR